MIELLACALIFVIAVWALALIFREAPEFDEVCTEPGCFRAATHQCPEGMSADGTPIIALVCRRHGRIPR